MRAAEPRHPNVIVFPVDDLGATDLGCDGSSFHKTPHIDQLAREACGSRRPTRPAVCSPTRASLLTGKYPAPARDGLDPGDSPKDRPLVSPNGPSTCRSKEWNLARAFHAADTRPSASGSGIWADRHSIGTPRGFDHNLGGTDRGQPLVFLALQNPDAGGSPVNFSPDREASEACRFIRENRERPFFLCLASYAVHQPIAEKRTSWRNTASTPTPPPPSTQPSLRRPAGGSGRCRRGDSHHARGPAA